MGGERKQWSDMPCEILSQVADRLDLMDLLRFRGVCRDFHAASCGAISSQVPWFLSYGTSSECSLLVCNKSNGWHKIFTLKIPELEGATTTVHGSSFGWLLVSRFFGGQGILFFLQPLSRKRINLLVPWDVLQIENHVAAFSSPPPSHDCILAIAGLVQVGVVHRVRLTVFSRDRRPNTNSLNWEQKFTDDYNLAFMPTIKGAAYYGQNFYFFDGGRNVMVFHPKTHSVRFASLLFPFLPVSPYPKGIFFTLSNRHVHTSGLRKMLGLDDDAPISTCGTAVGNGTTVICSELIRGQYSRIKGVWIRP